MVSIKDDMLATEERRLEGGPSEPPEAPGGTVEEIARIEPVQYSGNFYAGGDDGPGRIGYRVKIKGLNWPEGHPREYEFDLESQATALVNWINNHCTLRARAEQGGGDA